METAAQRSAPPETEEAKKLAKSGVTNCVFQNAPIPVENDLEKILAVIRGLKAG